MPIEIEKKYRLTESQPSLMIARLTELCGNAAATEFEVNTIYSNEVLQGENAILRLRRIGDRAILTFKKRFPSSSPIKRQLEEETEVSDPDSTERILVRLGFTPSLVYEKRRQTWKHCDTEIAIDELPFGWFMEIEGEESAIERVEAELAIDGLQAEEATYPQLTRTHGK
ncbi:MAG TPA: class IV adenylate cyclase, partial [Pyrinomonadaceae bacterium]|nr:class IV adenylate cyclase [Pyrinomonadaceae bacterium]